MSARHLQRLQKTDGGLAGPTKAVSQPSEEEEEEEEEPPASGAFNAFQALRPAEDEEEDGGSSEGGSPWKETTCFELSATFFTLIGRSRTFPAAIPDAAWANLMRKAMLVGLND